MQRIEEVIKFLENRKLQLVAAESCTAGLLTSLLANVSGCGSVFEMGYVVYSERAKYSCLGVDPKTIKTFGLTSEEVAKEMALGALARSTANVAIAVTGTAESNDELNGVVCFACAMTIAGKQTLTSETINFAGDRNEVRKAAATHAILRLPYYINAINLDHR